MDSLIDQPKTPQLYEQIARNVSMPVSTRSQTMNDSNPHQSLKKKLKPLTLVFKQKNLLPPKNPSSKNRVVARKLSLPETEKTGNRVTVFVRVRPISKKEKEAGSRCCVRIVNPRDVYLTEFVNTNDYLRLKRIRGRHFTFDACFPDSATQQEVYSTSTSELVEGVLQGRNGTVFCYGATGAGKTYTMLGTVESPGVMVLAIKDLFRKIKTRSCDGNHAVHLSYLEVYNETVRDLISPGRSLVLREDKQVMTLLQQGNRNRTTEPTRANETSSRSHAVLQVVVEYQVRDAAMNIINSVGKLSLVDLAGSERALATDQRTLRSLEGANINRSLLALSCCINALVDGKKHIPYRNSKLTQLLKDSLGGTCSTVMIANISPSNLSSGETQNTLHWADRAKEIRTKANDANEDLFPVTETGTDQAKLVLELQKENREMRMQLARQQQKLLTLEAQSLAAYSCSTPPSVSSLLSTPPTPVQPNEKRWTRSSFFTAIYLTPETKCNGEKIGITVRTLNQNVKSLESEIERMEKDHSLLIKQKDDVICGLSQKSRKTAATTEKVVTRSSILTKSARHFFQSPLPMAMKRSFCGLSGRKTRTHVMSEPTAHSSTLLQR
ncbi:kinesin-like protein KIN-8A isoform X2 [Cicer arietinum]|uniref:Kinesin-like protein n=1 Tax=Cicer arietinum TaxID=3827 RepID=A0A1S2XHW0_CICAR|nr:kinesin-like protein KIN-8A isoform X2 [Cicer arietinum]